MWQTTAAVAESRQLDTISATPRRFAPTSLSRWALGVLCATLAVVLFGAVVRITGSGAGCGQHWPTCHGEIVHLPRSVDTAIELTHRTTSGLSLLAVFALSVAAFRCFEPGHRVRRAAFWASGMMIVEALLGAGLVLFELVGADRSAARAVMMPLHLISTSVLTGALALVAWWSHPRDPRAPAGDRAIWKLSGVGLGLVLLVSATGALTALGDTVYPVQPAALGERWASDQAAGAHFLERLRVLHPIVAVDGRSVSDRDREKSPRSLDVASGARLRASRDRAGFGPARGRQLQRLALRTRLFAGRPPAFRLAGLACPGAPRRGSPTNRARPRPLEPSSRARFGLFAQRAIDFDRLHAKRLTVSDQRDASDPRFASLGPR